MSICTCLSKIRYHYHLTNKSYYIIWYTVFKLGYSINTNNNNQYVIISWCLDIVVGFSHKFLFYVYTRLACFTLHVT